MNIILLVDLNPKHLPFRQELSKGMLCDLENSTLMTAMALST